MEIVLKESLDRLAAIHQSLEKAIVDLPDEAMDWLPGPEMNTLGVLMAHTLGSIRFWVGDVAGGEPSGRVRDEEFKTAGESVAKFVDRSNQVLAHSQSVLAHLAPAELNDIRIVPNSEREVTVAWAILHALEHAALHAGHIEITRRLWEQHAGAGSQTS